MKNAARRETETPAMLSVHHRFYCPRCKGFVAQDVKRGDATFTFTCNSCQSAETFVLVAGLYVPKGLDAILYATAKNRLKEGVSARLKRRRA